MAVIVLGGWHSLFKAGGSHCSRRMAVIAHGGWQLLFQADGRRCSKFFFRGSLFFSDFFGRKSYGKEQEQLLFTDGKIRVL